MARELKAKIKIEAETKKARAELGKLDKAIDKTGKSTKSTTGILSKFSAGLVAAGVGIAVFTRGLKAAFAAAAVQEKAIAALNAQLIGLGDAAAGVSQRLQEQASALQNLSLAGDEEIISAQAQIAIFTKEEDEIKALTAAAIDLSAALGISLDSAAQLLGKTIGSTTNALSRYGVAVEGAVGSTERFNSLVEGLAKFSGAAAAQVGTFAGQLDLLVRNLFDSAENAAELATKSSDLIATLKLLNKEISELNAVADASDSRLTTVSSNLSVLGTTVAVATAPFSGLSGVLLTLQARLEAAADGSKELAEQQKKAAVAAKEIADAEKEAAAEARELEEAQQAAAAAADELAEAEKKVADELKKVADEQDRYIESLKKLGIELVDTDQLVADNEQSLKDLTKAYDDGGISQSRYLDGLEALNTSTLDIIDSNRNYASNIREQEIPALKEATQAVLEQTFAIDNSTAAKERNVIATREQIAVEQQQQRGAGDSPVTIGGGVFTLPPGVTVQEANGRVRSSIGGGRIGVGRS